jgi:hypothetical protein
MFILYSSHNQSGSNMTFHRSIALPRQLSGTIVQVTDHATSLFDIQYSVFDINFNLKFFHLMPQPLNSNQIPQLPHSASISSATGLSASPVVRRLVVL